MSVDATAICGSDMHFYDGDLDLGMAIPVGHEFLGTVLEVGPDVRRFRPGDRVLTASVAGCGACDGCATGDPVRCVEGPKVFGSGMLPGGQATAVAVPAADFQMLPDPRGDGRRGGPAADRQPVHRVGRGPAGRVPARAARWSCSGSARSGCARCAPPWRSAPARVLAVDPVAGRRARAVGVGGRGRSRARPSRRCSRRPAARGADAVIDAVAKDATLDAALAAVRAGGTVSVIGVHDLEPYPLPALTTLFRSVTLRMTTAPVHRTWAELVPLVQAGRLRTDGIFTHEFALADAPAAYAAVAERSPECIKVLLRP